MPDQTDAVFTGPTTVDVAYEDLLLVLVMLNSLLDPKLMERLYAWIEDEDTETPTVGEVQSMIDRLIDKDDITTAIFGGERLGVFKPENLLRLVKIVEKQELLLNLSDQMTACGVFDAVQTERLETLFLELNEVYENRLWQVSKQQLDVFLSEL